MNIEYTTTTVDSLEYKRLICGRTDDITKLLSYFTNGDSVALFGERRIGKTSLLLLLRDIINKDIRNYQAELIDADLKNAIPNLQVKCSDCIAVYATFQALPDRELETVKKFIYSNLQVNQLLNSFIDSRIFASNSKLPEIYETLEKVNKTCETNNKKLLIIIDEVEGLLDSKNDDNFESGKNIFINLKSVIQSCPKISFIFAGAEDWHKQIKLKTSPVASNIRTFYLKLPSRYAIENYLIKGILSRHIPISSRNDLNIAIKIILELTACKPFYVQASSEILIKIYQQNPQFSPELQEQIMGKVEESFKGMLDYFYENENIGIISQNILILLAKNPGLTIKQIASKLGYSDEEIYDAINDLELLAQIRKEGYEYYIVGKLIENWGKKTQSVQTINPWIQRSKWTIVALLVLLIPTGYIYTNPKSVTFTCKFTNGEVEVERPKSMELDENGEVAIKVKNTSSEVIKLLTVILKSDEIEYKNSKKDDYSNHLEFKNILANGGIKYNTMMFNSASKIDDQTFSSQIIVKTDKLVNNNPCMYDVDKRRFPFPIKKYWWIKDSLLLFASGFIARKNLLSIFLSLISQSSRSSKSEIDSSNNDN